MRIYIDIDGVLANYLKRLIHNYNQAHGTTHTVEEVVDWHFTSILKPGQKWGDYIDTHFWENLEIYPWAINLVRAVRDTGHPFAFLSSLLDEDRPKGVYSTYIEKRQAWLDNHFGPDVTDIPPSQRLILTRRKDLVVGKGDILIEDAPHFIEAVRKVGATVLVVAHPYNEGISDRLTPAEVLRYLYAL